MSTLQLGLIAGGVVVILAVLLYNWIQERRIRRRIAATFAPPAASQRDSGSRQEPTLADENDDEPAPARAVPAPASSSPPPRVAGAAALSDEDEDFVPPIDFAPARPQARADAFPHPPDHADAPVRPPDRADALATKAASGSGVALGPLPKAAGAERVVAPDSDIECVVTVQPPAAAGVGSIAAGFHARVGKPLRWFGRANATAPWQLLKDNTPGQFREFAACLLLADRAGGATAPMIERFVRLVADIAASIPAAFVAPDPAREVVRAEALDRFCATLDVQIGLTVLKSGAATIPGTRLRGVAEAAGFRLTDNGRFEYVQEDTGVVLYSLQNYRSEPFTIDNLRLTSTPGAVFILDVPRVPDPVRVFDQMKLAAKRLTLTLDATLVDDNRRPLNDASLTSIREQVESTAGALRESRLDPGSPRAMALFGG